MGCEVLDRMVTGSLAGGIQGFVASHLARYQLPAIRNRAAKSFHTASRLLTLQLQFWQVRQASCTGRDDGEQARAELAGGSWQAPLSQKSIPRVLP